MGDVCYIDSLCGPRGGMIYYYMTYDVSRPRFDLHTTPSKIYTQRATVLVQITRLLVQLNTIKVPEWPVSLCVNPGVSISLMNEGPMPGHYCKIRHSRPHGIAGMNHKQRFSCPGSHSSSVPRPSSSSESLK